MRLYMQIDVRDAIKAGKAQSGWLPMDVTEAQMTALSVEQREALAAMVDTASIVGELRVSCRLHPSEATIDTLLAEIDTVVARTSAAKAETEERCRKYAAEREDNILMALAKPLGDWSSLADRFSFSKVQSCYTDKGASKDSYAYTFSLGDDSRIAARLPSERSYSADRNIAEETRRAVEEKAAEKAEKEAQAKAQAEQKAAEEALDAWVAEFGSASQKARFAEGLLHEEELLKAIRDHVFAKLGDFARYEKMTKDDVEHEEGDKVAFCTEAAESLTDAQYTALVALREAAKSIDGASVKARKHEGISESSGFAERFSVLVSLDWHGISLSREYALPGRDE